MTNGRADYVRHIIGFVRLSGMQLLAAVTAFNTVAVARAQDEWPRFHFGLAVGQAHHGPTLSDAGTPDEIPPAILSRFGSRDADSVTGWKVVAGFRPARVVGAEIEYVDFGEAEIPPPSGNAIVRTHLSMASRAEALVLTSLLFIPEPMSNIDVYGKVGVAKLDESFQVFALENSSVECRNPWCQFQRDVHQTDSRPYVGFGARFQLGPGALRIEYELIDRDNGDDTTMLSIGLAGEWPSRSPRRRERRSSGDAP
jgi:OmpA family protein